MSTIIQCDICKQILSNTDHYTLNIDVKEYKTSRFSKHIIENLDFCDDCYNYFLKVIDNLKKGIKNGQTN